MRLNMGVDLHKQQFTYFSIEDGQYSKNQTDKQGYASFCKKLKNYEKQGYKVHLAVESTGNTRYFISQVEKYCHSVYIVNTLKFKVVNESVNKTDKRDAKTIADFLSKDMLPTAQLCSKESEHLKRLLASRDKLVKSNVKLKNQIHGILLSAGIETKAGQLNTKKGRKKAVGLVSEAIDADIIQVLVSAIESLEINIKDIEKKINSITENDRVVKILKTIPGTGDICAATVRAFIDDVSRFDCYQKFSAYSGLVPYVHISDETKHYGKITKRGPQYLRIALIQMVLGMIRCKSEKDNRYMCRYRALKKQKGSGKALVATARKFTKLVWTMLTNDEEYNPDKASIFYKIAKTAEYQNKDTQAA